MGIEIRIKKKNARLLLVAISIVSVALLGIIGTFFDPTYVYGALNQSVTTLLNVTNTEPNFYQLTLDDLAAPANEIVLSAGGLTEVYCNASASDPNGQADLVNATASIYAKGTGSGFFDTDNNASHYTNSTCTEFYNVPSTTNNRSLICRFRVDYFAFNTTWECNMTVRDFGGTQNLSQKLFLNATRTANVTLDALLAINVSASVLDYGNLSVTETSSEKSLNVTNVGNQRTNFTVLGFGGQNKTMENAGNSSMICQTGNISIYQERYSNTTGTSWPTMINLTFNTTIINNVTLQNRTHATDPLAGLTTNATYWRIRVPLSVAGLCNGTIQFAATSDAS